MQFTTLIGLYFVLILVNIYDAVCFLIGNGLPVRKKTEFVAPMVNNQLVQLCATSHEGALETTKNTDANS